MADATATEPKTMNIHKPVVMGLAAFGLVLTLLQYAGLLPAWLHRLPEQFVPPLAMWLDAIFNFIKDDLHLIDVTRFLTGVLQWMIDVTSNILYGKRRWPNFEAIPWSSIAAVAGIVGYYLGGWRLAFIGAGTFIWTALIGQWEIAMETMSVLVVAAPLAFMIGLLLGIWSWKSKAVENVLTPILSLLQTIPFFTYLLPAVIFFKVGPTAGAVATTIYAIPPMILMTSLGLKKVSPEVVEAGKMSGCTRWQMLRHVYIPSARTEILVGVNQVIMLSLAMVVLTAFIGMPGLGAKLLAMMGSFKLGRSLEIGITIVLLAVMLDRLSKAWVVKQPEHFEKGTSWLSRHKYLVLSVVVFIGFWIISQFWEILGEVGRREHFSQGRALDGYVKNDLLQNPVLKAVTNCLRVFMNNYVLIPFRNFLLSIPTPAFIAFVVAFAWHMAGRRQAFIALAFFLWVAFSGWWDRSVITIYYVLTSTAVAALIAIPLAVWGAGPPAQRIDFSKGINGSVIVGVISLIFRRSVIVFASMIVAGVLRYILWTLGIFGPEDAELGASYTITYWVIFVAAFYLIWRFAGQAMRDTFLLLAADTAQTFPSFVYLLPAIMLFSITPIAVLFAIMIFAMVPLIRYTIEGLRNVPPEMLESSDMSGATRLQKLWHVQFPLALPTMAVGFNQALMFAFFMTMIAAYIGTVDLGQELQRTLAGTDLGKNFVLGLNVAFMALTFDLVINKWASEKKKILGLD
ncbi:ABC transporter permease [Cognatiyoonia sp.]|uniref:ABC transporter permease n=1 Tax=Cognatiyoonia sp. TaxID=2211652 RepID=UPI003F6A0EDE